MAKIFEHNTFKDKILNYLHNSIKGMINKKMESLQEKCFIT